MGEYLTYYGMNQQRCGEIYQGLLNDTETAIQKSQLAARNEGKTEEEIEEIRAKYKTPDNGWQHITWSYLSMTDPVLAMDKFDNSWSQVQKGDQANTYWYIHSMMQSGYKTEDIFATGDIAATVYYNKETNKYTAMAWNPTEKEQSVDYYRDGKKTGTTYVNPHSLVRFEIPLRDDFVIRQTTATQFTVKGFYDDSVHKNVQGRVIYEDNQYVEITCADPSAVIHYTVDGTVPTEESPVYTEPIMVSDNMVIKTYTCKEGYIDSGYTSLDITIQGTEVTNSENVALGKPVAVSGEEGKSTLGSYITDGDEKTRWSSEFNDEQWCYVDLKEIYPINTVTINWQNSYAEEYEIQVSVDGEEWKTVAVVSNSQSGVKTTTFDAVYARYVKMQGLKRHTIYGYSIWEMEIYTAKEADPPQISVEELKNGKNRIRMSTTVKGALIKYTLDGTEPAEDSFSYTGPIEVGDAVISAVTYRKGMVLSKVTSQTVTERPPETTKVTETNQTEAAKGTETVKSEKKTAVSRSKAKNVVVGRAKIKRIRRYQKRRKAKVYLRKLKGVRSYQIKISTSNKFKKKRTRTRYVRKNRFTMTRLKKKKTYYIKVRACVIRGGKRYFGKWSAKKKIKP